MITIEIPRTKFIVKVCPNNTAEATPVKIVAIVDEYFFKIVSAFIIDLLKYDYSSLAKTCVYSSSNQHSNANSFSLLRWMCNQFFFPPTCRRAVYLCIKKKKNTV